MLLSGHPFHKFGIGLGNVGEIISTVLFLICMVSPETEIKEIICHLVTYVTMKFRLQEGWYLLGSHSKSY